MTIGERIHQLRQQHNLTLRDLATQAGIDYTYLSKIENDRLDYTPSVKTIQALAKILKVDELELLDLANKVPSPLAGLTANRKALTFFREAQQSLKSSKDWDKMLRYLKNKGRKGG